MVSTVFFDVGATLIRPKPSMGEIYQRVLGEMSIVASVEEFMRLFEMTWAEISAEVEPGKDRYRAFAGGEMGYWREYVRRVLARLGSGANVEDATRALHEAFSEPGAWTIFPDALDALPALKARGVRMGIISNWDSRLPGLLRGLDLAHYFNAIVFSARYGEEKPARGIFLEALDQMAARPDESLHVGDDLRADYGGARAAGMMGVLLDRAGNSPESVVRIESLGELAALLDSELPSIGVTP